MTIKIDNPKIESFFKNEFKSDIEKFSEFILQNLEAYNQKKEFDITPLDPEKNAYRLHYDNLGHVEEDANPFKNIEDVATYAKKLRENAWR